MSEKKYYISDVNKRGALCLKNILIRYLYKTGKKSKIAEFEIDLEYVSNIIYLINDLQNSKFSYLELNYEECCFVISQLKKDIRTNINEAESDFYQKIELLYKIIKKIKDNEIIETDEMLELEETP